MIFYSSLSYESGPEILRLYPMPNFFLIKFGVPKTKFTPFSIIHVRSASI